MKNYKHSKIIQEISKKLDINPIVVNIVIVQFFNGIRNALKNNQEINIKGYFKIKMLKHFKKKLKNNSTINLRKRKHKKRYK
jgi:nucleoid DNA-binding protein